MVTTYCMVDVLFKLRARYVRSRYITGFKKFGQKKGQSQNPVLIVT
jgi:hypothetical protein